MIRVSIDLLPLGNPDPEKTRNLETQAELVGRVKGEGVEIMAALLARMIEITIATPNEDDADLIDRGLRWLKVYAGVEDTSRFAAQVRRPERTADRQRAHQTAREGTQKIADQAWSRWSYETAERTGKLCVVCNTPQVKSPGGDLCAKGHGGASGYYPDKPEARPHVFHKCSKEHCMICEGGLLHCEVCGEGEGTLADYCPGKRQASP